MNTYEILRNRASIGTVKAVSLRQALVTARRRYGRCEVIAVNMTRADRFFGPDTHRTEMRRPCNNTAQGRAAIEAIRLAEIERWKTMR